MIDGPRFGRFTETARLVLAALRLGPRSAPLLDEVRTLDGPIGPGTLYAAIARLKGQLAGLLLAIGALVATSFNTESTMAFAAVPIGLAWIAVGMVGALRRARTPAPAGT